MENDLKDFTTEELLKEIISRNDIRDRSVYDDTDYEVQIPIGESGCIMLCFDSIEADLLEVIV